MVKMQNYFKNLEPHHAYLAEGAKDNIVPDLILFLEKEWNFVIKANPDFWHGDFETFGIDDGNFIKEMQTRRSFSGGKKIFVITANFFTREAQNSLLKILEEPVLGVHFFIITQNTQSLLPTLKSRLHPISLRRQCLHREIYEGSKAFADEFLGANTPKRIELLKDIIENKDKNGAIRFLDDIESVLYKNTKKDEITSGGNMSRFKEIQKCREYLNDRAPSVKMILEHIAMIV
jgi:hypothetical protein